MKTGQRGALLMGLLVLLALLAGTMAVNAQAWSDQRRREREQELLFVGQQLRQALKSYYLSSPGAVKHLPVSVDELLRDSRFPAPVRHLRKAYADPMEPGTPWGVLRKGAQIIGFYSQAAGEPVIRAGFSGEDASFTGALTYSQWQFIFLPAATAPNPARPGTPS